MAIGDSGINGPFRKKVGAVIGRRHRGLNVMTGLYRENNKPSTAKQLVVQEKFGLLSNFLNGIDQLVNLGFKAKQDKTAVNMAYAYNYDHAFVKVGDAYELDYRVIVYSRGNIAKPESAKVVFEDGSIVFSWLPQNQNAYCQFFDTASFLVYNPAKDRMVKLINSTERYDLKQVIKLPAEFAGDLVHCYMNFSSANGRHSGDSMYVAGVKIPGVV